MKCPLTIYKPTEDELPGHSIFRFIKYFIQMKTRHTSLLVVLLFLISGNVFSQWINFIDQTDDRIVISNVNDNDDSNAVDDMEKDFVVGDYDNNGYDDLIVVRKNPFSFAGGKTDLILMNDGNGELVDRTDIFAPEFLSSSTDARDAVRIDANDDGWMDIFIANTFQDQPRLFMNLGNDSNGNWLGFADDSTNRLPVITLDLIQFCAAAIGDVTGNGAMDIFMVNYDQSGLALDVLFINDGNGNFTDETETRMGNLRNSSFGTASELHDVDNDEDLDIIKNLGLGGVSPFGIQGTKILFNNGDGTFTNFQNMPGAAPYMFNGGDLDNDGLIDYYHVDDGQDYVNFATAIQVDQNVTFNQDFINSDRTDVWGGNVKMVDLDGDGDLDVTIASVDTDEPPCDTSTDNGQAGGVRVFTLFENEDVHSGNIIDPYNNIDQPWNISNYDQDFIDINNDGALDLILGDCEGYRIFMQETDVLAAEDVIFSNNIQVYPNPSNGIVNVIMSEINSADVSIEVYSVTGKLMTTFSRDTASNNIQQFDLDLRAYVKSGIYFLEFATDNGVATKKILVE